MSEMLLQIWVEYGREYKITHSITTDQITLRKYSRHHGTTEWFPENQIITVSKSLLLNAIADSVIS